LSKKQPDLKVVPPADADAPATEPQPDPNRADTNALSITGLVRSIGALTRQVAEDQRIPIGAATAIVKTGLEFHLNAKALALQEANSRMPFFQPQAAAEDTDGVESDS